MKVTDNDPKSAGKINEEEVAKAGRVKAIQQTTTRELLPRIINPDKVATVAILWRIIQPDTLHIPNASASTLFIINTSFGQQSQPVHLIRRHLSHQISRCRIVRIGRNRLLYQALPHRRILALSQSASTAQCIHDNESTNEKNHHGCRTDTNACRCARTDAVAATTASSAGR
jgi:hypothetical protein